MSCNRLQQIAQIQNNQFALREKYREQKTGLKKQIAITEIVRENVNSNLEFVIRFDRINPKYLKRV